MTTHRWAAVAIALTLSASALVALPDANAQTDEDPVVVGAWEGTLTVDGSQNTYTTVTGTADTNWVITPSVMTLDLTVDENGAITLGTLQVDIVYDMATSGTGPDGASFSESASFRDVATLDLSGTIERMVASGTLTANRTASSTLGPSSDSGPVEWVFEGTASDCDVVEGSLADVAGRSIMAAVGRPVGGEVVSSTMRAETRIWPDTADLDLLELEADVEAALALPPTTPELLDLIYRINLIVNDLNSLDRCQLEALGFTDGGAAWLASLARGLIEMALERVDEWRHFEVITFVRLANRAGLFTNDEAGRAIYDDLGRALDAKLAEAAIAEDFKAIADIMIEAGHQGYDWLHDKAEAALDAFLEDG